MAKNREPESKPKPEEDSSESESGSESGSESESEPEQKTPIPKPLNPPPPTSTSSSESESLSGSESESDSEPEPEPEPVTKPKPSPVLNTPVKRAGEKIPESPDSKKVKKTESPAKNDVAKTESVGEESSKKMFQRVFSVDDEIALLKDMLDFIENKKGDPIVKVGEFMVFAKSLSRLDVTKAQLINKMKRLRSKYKGNASKGDVKSSRRHEREAYELSKKIWVDLDLENDCGLESKKVNGSVAKKDVVNVVALPVRDDSKVNGGSVGSHGVSDLVGFSMSSGLEERIMKEEIKNVGKEMQKELGKKLREIEVAELELCVRRCEYVAQKARLMIAAKKNEH